MPPIDFPLHLIVKLFTLMSMRRLLLVTGFIILSYVLTLASSFNPESAARVKALTLDGLERAYNFDFSAANKLFNDAIGTAPLHPRPYVSKSFLALWQFLLSKNDSDLQTFLALTDRSVEVGERYLETYGEDAEALTCLGTAYGYRAFAYGRVKSYLKAAWDGKKSYDYLYDALKLDPHAYDAYLGIGMYHCLSSHLTKPLRWIVSILGITGDGDLGMKELRLAAERGTYTKIEAQYCLAQFLPWQEGDFTTSEQMLNTLLSQYPDNSLLRFTVAVWEIRNNDVLAAKEHLSAVVHQQQTHLQGILPLAAYKLAECNFRLFRYDEARGLYQKFLTDSQGETYRATSNYRIGLCFELTGHRYDALPFYKRAQTLDHSFGDDAYSSRKAVHRLTSPLAAGDTLLISAQNALNSGAYDQSLSLYTELKSMPKLSHDVAVEAIFGTAETYFQKKLYNDALQEYQQVIAAYPKEEIWLIPWSHYQSAICHLKFGQREAARREFEKVQEYDDYDFKNWLFFRAERELAKIKN